MDEKMKRMRHNLFFPAEKVKRADLNDAMGLGVISQREHARLMRKSKYKF